MLSKALLCTGETISRCRLFKVLAAGLVLSLFLPGVAFAQGLHGVTFLKGCESPTLVGDPYMCSFSIANTFDTGKDAPTGPFTGDTITITALNDVVAAHPDDVDCGDILPDLTFQFIGGASCADDTPSTGLRTCTLPPGGIMISDAYSCYTTDQSDFDNLPNQILPDDAVLTWQDTCDTGANNCPIGDQENQTGSQTTIVQPDIDIEKEVSLDNVNFFDADSPPGPIGLLGADAWYQLTVTNTGTETLANVLINDPTLGLVNVPLPGTCLPFDPTDVCILDSGDIAALFVDERCDSTGVKLNTASVAGEGASTGEQVSDSDPANLTCVDPDIDIEKEVSLDNVNFFDADTPPGPIGPLGADAWYQLTVTNTGSETLVNVLINDPTLGLVNVPLPDTCLPFDPTDVCILDSGDIAALFVDERCDSIGVKLNTASVAGEGALSAEQVSDSDPANLTCTGTPSLDVTKTGPPEVKYGDTYDNYVICAINDGDVNLENCTGTDDRIGDLGKFEPGVGLPLLPGDANKVCKTFSYTVPVDETADPVINRADITCDAFAGTASATTVTDFDTHSAPVFVVDGDMTKVCRPNPATPDGNLVVGGEICWDVTLSNSGDKDLTCDISDPTAGISATDELIPVGGSQTYTACRTVLEDEAGKTISNTATADCEAVGYTNAVDVCKTPADCQADCYVPGEELCRTPGFWKSHAGVEKDGRSNNLTQTVIDYSDAMFGTGDGTFGLGTICGVPITDTTTYDYSGTGFGDSNGAESAVEGMCVHPKQKIVRQLQRQLIAAAINCVASGGDATCTGISVGPNWKLANTACVNEAADMSSWVDEIDDFNNGEGDYDCMPNIQDSIVFDGWTGPKLPGPAGSSWACGEATSNKWYLVPDVGLDD